MEKNSKIGTHGTEIDKAHIFSTYVFHDCNCTAMVTLLSKDKEVITHVCLKKHLPHQNTDQKNIFQILRQSRCQHMFFYISNRNAID